jgi:hypothetical protein
MVLEYSDPVTPDDLEAATSAGLTVVEERPLNFIVDLSQMTKNTLKLTDASRVRSFTRLIAHRNSKMFVLVKPPLMAQLVIPIFFRGANVRTCATLEEARTLIAPTQEDKPT